MGKKSRKKKLKKRKSNPLNHDLPIFTQMDEEGLHALIPGIPPSEEKLEEMSKIYQERIRHSPLWDEMVNRFGENKALELLKEFRVKVGE